MVDISKAKREFSKEDKYILDWLNNNGFDAVLKKQRISKLYMTVSKDGVTDHAKFESRLGYSIEEYMECYRRFFELLCELQSISHQKKENIKSKPLKGKKCEHDYEVISETKVEMVIRCKKCGEHQILKYKWADNYLACKV